jgi:hypothetical protein
MGASWLSYLHLHSCQKETVVEIKLRVIIIILKGPALSLFYASHQPADLARVHKKQLKLHTKLTSKLYQVVV